MARRQVSIFINGTEVQNTIKGITAEKRKLTNQLNKMTIGSKEYNAAVADISKLDGKLRNHRDQIRGVEKGWSIAGGSIGKVLGAGAALFAVDKIVQYGSALYNTGLQMEVLTKKAEVVFGDSLPQVTKAAEENAAAMGLTISGYTDAASAIGDLLIPMGFQREEAANISTGLVDLSGALSEWSGGQKSAEEVSKTLAKAMLGEREELKGLGISITEADVKQRLYEKGLDKLTGTTLQQAKAAATLELITEKSVDAQTAFANNADTNIRKQAELTARLTDVKETISQALIPVFARLLEIAVPIVEVIADIATSMTSTEESTGTLSKVMSILGSYLGNVWNFGKLLLALFLKLSSFIFISLTPVIKGLATVWIGLYNGIVAAANAIQEFAGIDTGKLKPIDISAFRKSIDDAGDYLKNNDITEFLQGGDSTTAPGKKNNTGNQAPGSGTPTGGSGADAAADKSAKKEADNLKNRYEKLLQVTKDYYEADRLARLSEEDRTIQELETKFNEQIQEALALEAKGYKGAREQRLGLEALKEQQVTELRNKYADQRFAADMERIAKESEDLILADLEATVAREEARQATEQQIAAYLREAVLTEQQQQLLDLENQYTQLQNLAEQNGIETLDIEIAYRKKRAKLEDQYRKEGIDKEAAAAQARAQVLEDSYTALSTVISGAINLISDEGTEAANLSKLLTLAQIGIDTASAISSLTRNSEANPANAVTFGGAGAIQFATGLARVLTNIGSARKVLRSIAIPQRKLGGWFDVNGEDDGRTYNAQFIGSGRTGMLPSHPVVLASEAGPEYFVANKDLGIPSIANHVRAIENIKRYGRGGIPQYAEGGFTNGTGAAASSDSTILPILEKTISVLERIERNGVTAMVYDDTIVGINKRYKKINDASGNTL